MCTFHLSNIQCWSHLLKDPDSFKTHYLCVTAQRPNMSEFLWLTFHTGDNPTKTPVTTQGDLSASTTSIVHVPLPDRTSLPLFKQSLCNLSQPFLYHNTSISPGINLFLTNNEDITFPREHSIFHIGASLSQESIHRDES